MSRSGELITTLGLEPHPEGGFYRELFRSPHMVTPDDGRPLRRALSSIYFLLPAGGRSSWHRVLSDEIWTHLEGDPLTLITFEGEERSMTLGPLLRGFVPMHVVPAGVWQAAEVETGYALVACFVAPGFEFEDFTVR